MSVEIRQSRRLEELPPYVFSEINAIKAEAQKRGVNLLSLAIGDPDQPTPRAIVERLKLEIENPENHVYSPYEGTFEFRKAVSDWMKKRFGVSVKPDGEVVALIGSKEGIAHFPLAFLNPGDKCLVPTPGYPIFSTSISIAGGIPIGLPHRPENGFLPDLAETEKLIQQHKPKYLLLNFPANPTSAVASKAFLTDVVRLAQKYGTWIVYDNAYSEIYYDESNRPHSIFEVPGAEELAIELQSFSKTFNMTGWRIAYAVGNPKLVAGLLRVKTNIDSGPLLAIQAVSKYALENADSICPEIRNLYAGRRELLLSGLDRLGVEYHRPQATFFVWAKVPVSLSSMDFTKALIEKQGLVITPGMGFGAEGEGFFRFALTVGDNSIRDALSRLEKFLATR